MHDQFYDQRKSATLSPRPARSEIPHYQNFIVNPEPHEEMTFSGKKKESLTSLDSGTFFAIF